MDLKRFMIKDNIVCYSKTIIEIYNESKFEILTLYNFFILQRDTIANVTGRHANYVQLSRKFHWHPTVGLCLAIRIDLHTKLPTSGR